MSFQKRPTTTGDNIIGTRIRVVTSPLPKNLSRTNIAKIKPRMSCNTTEKRTYCPVVVKYYRLNSI